MYLSVFFMYVPVFNYMLLFSNVCVLFHIYSTLSYVSDTFQMYKPLFICICQYSYVCVSPHMYMSVFTYKIWLLYVHLCCQMYGCVYVYVYVHRNHKKGAQSTQCSILLVSYLTQHRALWVLWVLWAPFCPTRHKIGNFGHFLVIFIVLYLKDA